MPLLSAALYVGQFLSPLVISPTAKAVFGEGDASGVYKIGIVVALLFVVQVACTRKFQALPPVEKHE